MTVQQKVDVARQLGRLGVDIIDAGFPSASPGEVEAVKLIAKEVGNCVDEDGHVSVICAIARCTKADIDAAWEAVRHAMRPRILTFIATSDIHLKHKLKKSREEVVRIAREMVAYARSLGCQDIEFGAEDAARSDREFLYQILEEVRKAGATTLVIPDTGAFAGARQIEVTINGIGERAGNASLEEVVMAIRCRGEEQLGGIYTGINAKQIARTSQMVSKYTGMLVQPNKAIIGANAFAHESGIHQDGILKFKGTYEILSPEDIGLVRASNAGIVLGKLSGRHALRSKLLQLGYELNKKEMDDVFHRFKVVAEKKKIPVTLLDYSLSSVTKGIDAIASTKVLLRGQQGHSSTYALNGETTKRTFSGTGAGTDIVVSSVQAYINALNKLLGFRVGSMGKTSGKVPNVSA